MSSTTRGLVIMMLKIKFTLLINNHPRKILVSLPSSSFPTISTTSSSSSLSPKPPIPNLNPKHLLLSRTIIPSAAPPLNQIVGPGRFGAQYKCVSASGGAENQGEKVPMASENQSTKLLTLPTILTLGRVAAVPLLITTFYVDTCLGKNATTAIFILAAITDWLDGYLARKMRLGSAFGAFLDPVADKLMVAATLVLLCSRPQDVGAFGQPPWLLVVPSIAIIGREITMSAVREWAASQNTKLLEAVAVNNLGKWKTATQMIALTILLATRDNSLGGPEFVVTSGVVLLYISAGLAVWSLVVYMSKIWKVLLR